MALFSWRRKALLGKLETVYGTDPVPTAMLNGILAMNLEITLSGEKLEREIDRAFFTANPFVLVGKKAEIKFDFEPMGADPGGVVAPCNAVMEMCAHAVTLDAVGPPLRATYNPISDAIKSGTLYVYIGTNLMKISGCRGTIDWTVEIKKFIKGSCTLTGFFDVPENAALAMPDLSNWQQPAAIETETWLVSVDGTPINTNSITLSMNQDTPMIEGSEEREVVVTDRQANGVLKVYDPTVAVFDFFDLAQSHARVPIICEVDGGTSKLSRFTVALAQFEMPKFVEIEGVRGLEIPYNAIASDAGSDEYVWDFE